MKAARRIGPALSTALLAATLPLAAQSDPRGIVSEEIGVNEVLLDVLVTDRQGNVILGLDRGDFVVEEEGRPVEINDVTFYSNRRFLESSELAGELGIDAAAVPVERYFILFFHDQRRLSPRLASQLLNAGLRVRRWVETELLSNDYVAVVSYQVRLRLHQDFTADREALVAAIDEVVRGVNPKRERPADEGVPSLFANLRREKMKRRTRIYDALQAVAAAATAVRGRKNLILFSSGFGAADGFSLAQPDYPDQPQTVKALNRNNVAVYAIDLVPAIARARPAPLSSSLGFLADDTGGRYYFNFVNFSTPLEQISRELNGYYLLSYTRRPPDSGSEYRKVRVKTMNPELRVRTREGYGGGGQR